MNRAAACLTAALALACVASTCDTEDLSGRFVVTLGAGQQRVVQAYSQPYIGRLALDYGLTNTGESPAIYLVSAQSQTSGAQDARACDNGISSTPRAISATAWDLEPDAATQVPTVRDENRAHFVSIPDAGAGRVNVRFRRTSTYRVFVSGDPAAVALFSPDGNPVEPVAVITAGSCELFAAALEFEVTDGTYALRIDEDELVLLVEQACTSVRTVPRACPGTASDLFEETPIRLEPGGFVSGRISTAELGIGNRAVVGIECSSEGDDCAAELEMFFAVEQLECRRDTDCATTEACTEDGYCRRVRDRGCSSATGRGPMPALALAGCCALLRRRRLA